MIRWGSDNGFDSIAWVTGKQSAERYKVSTQISEVHWQGTDFTAYDHSGNRVIQQTGVTEKGLEELIGKEPAKKLMAQPNLAPPTSNKQQRKLSGLDLDIGGEYHKLIYDQVLTAQAKKIGKKHGAKVEESGVIATDPDKMRKAYEENYSDSFEMHEIRDHPDVFEDELASTRYSPNDVVIVDPNGEYLRDMGGDIVFFDDDVAAGHRIDSLARNSAEDIPERFLLEMYKDADEAAEKVWSMRLTDKLKQASKDGMPYYVALPPLVIGGAAAQRTDAQRQQSKSDAQSILAN